ncbi:Histidine--tRNA ligase [Alphaproteobacteria bacterium]
MLNNISGFPEFLPRDQIAFNRTVEIIRRQFELYGFTPLDTPVVERISTLLAKGNDSEIYGIHRLADVDGAEKKDLALRFDLTVPLARYVAQHYGNLTFPYRRYHIAPVWRGERPQAGRYRQFYQCDIDIIGDGALSLIHDAEVLSVIYNVFRAIGLTRFIIKINNRYILTGLIKAFGISEGNISPIMRTIDKAEKITSDILQSELISQGLSMSDAGVIVDITSRQMSNAEWIRYLKALCTNEEFVTGISELQEVLHNTQAFGIPNSFLQIAPALARGLNYYTGTVSETRLLDYLELGSVCGGGRYANLAGTFSSKQLPGVGFSIGISRLIPKLIEAGIIKAEAETPARVLITTQNPDFMLQYIQMAKILRDSDINTELYLARKSLGAQMKYANKKGVDFAIIADKAEFDAGQIILRYMASGAQSTATIEDAINIIRNALYQGAVVR